MTNAPRYEVRHNHDPMNPAWGVWDEKSQAWVAGETYAIFGRAELRAEELNHAWERARS